MRDHGAFEARLADAFDRYGAGAPLAVDARALTHALAATRAARPTLADRWAAVFGVRRLAPVLLLLLLALATAVIGALAFRLLDRETRVFGMFEPIPGWAPGNVGDGVALADGRILVLQPPDEGGNVVYDSRTGGAEPVDPLPDGRYGSRLVALADGGAVVLGGQVDDPVRDATTHPRTALLFDPATASFRETDPGPMARYWPTAVQLGDGGVLVLGGNDEDGGVVPGAEILDPRTGRFAPAEDPTIIRAGASAISLADGRVLVAGGFANDEGITAAAELYDPASGRFAPTGSMTTPRGGHALALLADGRVLVAGGRGVAGDLHTAEIFDPSSGRFSPTGSLTTERGDHDATALPDGRVLVTGGSNAYGEPRTAEIFDPATGRFELAGGARAGTLLAAAQPDGSVVVLGAGRPERWQAATPVAAPPVGHEPAPAFAGTGSPVASRTGHTATLLVDGRVLITGGRTQDLVDGSSAGALRSAEVYDPATGAFTSVDAMSQARVGHATATLPDGRVLVVGGDVRPYQWTEENWLTSELYDPATDQFSIVTGRLAWGRRGCTADLATPAGGRPILVAACPGGTVLQAFDPATGWAEPRPLDGLACHQGLGIRRFSVVAVDDGIAVFCRGDATLGFLVDPATAVARPIDRSPAADPGQIAGAAVLPDGRVVAVVALGLAVVDLESGTASIVDRVAGRRSDSGLTVLPDGRVLVTGGRGLGPMMSGSGGRPDATAHLWDPSTGARAIGPMAAGRAGHTATLLPDGRVLLVGGVERSPDRTDPEPVGAEIFDPAGLTPAGTATPAP